MAGLARHPLQDLDTSPNADLKYDFRSGAPTGQDYDTPPQFAFADVNNDDRKDIIISRTTDDPYYTISGTTFTLNTDGSGTQRTDAGMSYILYQPSSWATPVSQAFYSYNLAGVDGIKIAGAANNDAMAVEGPTDMNKDGKDDLLLRSGLNPTGGYFLFGKTAWPITYDTNCMLDTSAAHCSTQIGTK